MVNGIICLVSELWWGNPTVWSSPHVPGILSNGLEKKMILFATERLKTLLAHSNSWWMAEAPFQARWAANWLSEESINSCSTAHR